MIEVFGKPKNRPQKMIDSKLFNSEGEIIQEIGKVYFFRNNYSLEYYKFEDEYMRHKILKRTYIGYCKTSPMFGFIQDNRNYNIIGHLGPKGWKLKDVVFTKKSTVTNQKTNACFCKFSFKELETFKIKKTDNKK